MSVAKYGIQYFTNLDLGTAPAQLTLKINQSTNLKVSPRKSFAKIGRTDGRRYSRGDTTNQKAEDEEQFNEAENFLAQSQSKTHKETKQNSRF